MNRLFSIEEVSKRFDTSGSRPLLVHASDLEYYICKYPFYPRDPKLLNEYLAFHFARIWDIRIPNLGIVQVQRDHLPPEMLGMQLSYLSIENPMVGLKQVDDVMELIDPASEGISDSILRKHSKLEFLKIALFDLWLSNEDRNCGNMNLLVNFQDDVIAPIAIDHEKIFNSGSPFGQIYALSYEETLFYSRLFHCLFRSMRRNNLEMFNQISASLQPYVSRCQQELRTILDGIPREWGFDSDEIYEALSSRVFSPEWIEEVARTYQEYLSLMTQKP